MRIPTDTGVRNVMGDPKRPKGIRASYAEWTEIRAAKLANAECRLCGKREYGGLQLHHIVPKGMGGGSRDDVLDNLVPLCPVCHGLVEARNPWARSILGQRFSDAERAYVIGKRGAGWLDKNYGTREEAA